MKIHITFFLFFLSLSSFGQIGEGKLPKLKSPGGIKTGNPSVDSLKLNKRTRKSEIVYPINAYKQFTLEGDTLSVDTILDIRRIYRLNYILKDDISLLPFQNMGLGFNLLDASILTSHTILPGFVAAEKNFNEWKKEEIPFYNVPTAYSDLFYLNGIGQGQMLRAFITSNITPGLNFLIGYKGISSLGLYKNSATSLGRFFFSLNYRSKNKKYESKIFFVSHDLKNEENGGIKNPMQFESGDPAFYDRSRMEVNIDNAEIRTFDKQFYWNQSYFIFNRQNLSVENELYVNNKKYIFDQSLPSDFIGPSFTQGAILDSTQLNLFRNDVWVAFKAKNIKLKTGLGYIQNNYKWDSIKHISGITIPKELIYKDISWNSKAAIQWKKFHFKGKLEIIPTQDMQSYFLQADLVYKKDSLTNIKASLVSDSKRPDFKYILFQSGYEKFNWYHPDFSNVQHQELKLTVSHAQWGEAEFKNQVVNHYTYFGLDSLPHQYGSTVAVSSIRIKNDLNWYKFGLASDWIYQKVLSGEEVFSVPEFILRESIYYSNRFFKRHLHLQTGFTVKYFTSFYASAYHPVLGDYYMQRTQKIGDFMWLDYFVNFKVKRFRFYLKAEHLNALWERTAPKYYSAPGYPMRDFNIRFGINWIFFN